VRLDLPPRPRARRTHAERRAETRAKILAAVVDSIAEQGFQRTTAQAIAARAGVTWGAVQHQFGGKDGLLLAVLEDSFNRFAERMTDIAPGKTTLDERASLFVDRAWEHYSSRHFRSTFEILLSYLGREEHADAGDWRGEMARAWDGLWSRVFADAKLTRGKSLTLQNFVISALTGLAQTATLAGTAKAPKAELELLKDALARSLRESS
jgi:AcrR family transcriptional regulator